MALKECVKHFFKGIQCAPPPPTLQFLLGGSVSYPISKKGGLTGSQFLEGGCWKRGGNFFQQGGRGCSFYIKNKLQSEVSPIFTEGGHKKTYRGNCLKRKLGQFVRTLAKKREVGGLKGGLIPGSTICFNSGTCQHLRQDLLM